MTILLFTTCIVGMIFMAIMSFAGIWILVTSSKVLRQMRYRNYILEKIYTKIDINSNPTILDSNNSLNLEKDITSSNIDNVKNFDIKNKAH